MVRDAFHEQLDDLNEVLVTMAHSVTDAMRLAGDALLSSDAELAERVIASDTAVNTLHNRVDDRVVELMTQYQPVATDLRFILGSIRIATDLERMGDLAKHIAKTAKLRAPACAVPPQVRDEFQAMHAAAMRIASKAAEILGTRDRLDAAQLPLDDDEMDALHRELYRDMLANWPYGPETAVDVALLARFFERYADHAVRIAQQVVYLVTGEVHLHRQS